MVVGTFNFGSPLTSPSLWISGISLPAAQDAPMFSSKWFFPIRIATWARMFASEFDGECSIAFLYCHGVIPFKPAAVVLLALDAAFIISSAVIAL